MSPPGSFPEAALPGADRVSVSCGSLCHLIQGSSRGPWRLVKKPLKTCYLKEVTCETISTNTEDAVSGLSAGAGALLTKGPGLLLDCIKLQEMSPALVCILRSVHLKRVHEEIPHFVVRRQVMCLQQADTQAPARNWLWVRGVFQATCDPERRGTGLG